MDKYELHELATIFPEMDAERFEAFKDSIRRNGQKTPVTLYQGKIIDGRHRYRACRELGIDVRVTEYTGNDPVQVVRDNNMNDHRHLSDTDRAICAAKLESLKQGARTDLRPNGPKLVTRRQAAEIMDVSPTSVKRAAKVLKDGVPELVKAVDEKKITLSAAYEVASLPEEEQRQIVTSPTPARPIRKPTPRIHTKGPIVPLEYQDSVAKVIGGGDFDGRPHDAQWVFPADTDAEITKAVKDTAEAIHANRIPEAIILLPSVTESKWFQDTLALASAACFVAGKIKFRDRKGNDLTPPVGSAFLYFGENTEPFRREFFKHGYAVINGAIR